MPIVNIKNLDVSSFAVNDKSKFVYINEPPNIQLPYMKAPFGVGGYDGSKTLDLSLSDEEVQQKFEELDKFAETHATGEYKSIIRPSNDERYDPTIRVKLTDSTQYFTADGEETDITAIKRGASLGVVFIPALIWNIGANSGFALRAEMVVTPQKPRLSFTDVEW